MKGIQVAALQRGSKLYPFEGKDHQAIMVGDIRPEGGTKSLRAFVKICQNQAQLHAELTSSVLGRALSLNIPEPFIVVIRPEALPPIEISEPVLGFGTAAVAGHSFARLGNFASVLGTLKNLDLVAAFDQLIANADRHLGQMIYDGRDHWAIDHAQSYGGSVWGQLGLPSPEIDIINWLLQHSDYGERLSSDEPARHALRAKANKAFYPLVGNVQGLFREAGLERMVSEHTLHDLYIWLEKRISHAVVQICQKIGLPDMGYETKSSQDSRSSLH